MKKYPRIPHVPGSKVSEDDISVDYPQGRLLVYEKLDGTNLGVSLSVKDGVGELNFQNRGGFLENKRPHPQWDAAKNWFNQHYWGIMNYFAQNPGHTVFGEWLYAKHSIYYDRLPSYFMVYDIFDGQDFVKEYYRLHEAFRFSSGLALPKVIRETDDIHSFLSWYPTEYEAQYSSDPKAYEGFIFRDVYDHSRVFKYVRPEFTAGIKEHWFNRKLERNKLL